MARPAKVTDRQIEAAMREIKRGAKTLSAAAAALGMSGPGLAAAIKRYEKKLSALESAPVETESRADAPAADAEPLDIPPDLMPPASMTLDDQRAWFTDAIRTFDRIADDLYAAGEIVESRKSKETARQMNLALLRINNRDDASMLHISKDALEEKAERLRANMKQTFAARGLRCCDCNRELSIRWGKGE